MAPNKLVVWTSWPQACMMPGRLEAYGTSLAS